MLFKFGSQLKIEAAGLTLEDVTVVPEKSTQHVLEPKHSDHLYFRARAISALETSGPNGNGDGFPRVELEASYETFVGRNLFLNHESDHPIKSVGKIIDAYAVEDPESKEYYIECLAKIDRKLHPEIARKVETGELNTVSMGCSCEQSMCSVCGTKVHTDMDEKCAHLSPGGLLKEYAAILDMPEYGIQKGAKIKAYAINTGIHFNELSIVNVPADSKAFIKTIISNLKHQLVRKASLNQEEQITLLASMETILSQLDAKTRDSVKAEFCSCSPVKEGSVSEDKKVDAEAAFSPEEEIKQILKRTNAYDYTRLMSSLEKKQQKQAWHDDMKPIPEMPGEAGVHSVKEQCENCGKWMTPDQIKAGKCGCGANIMAKKEDTLFQRVADKVFKSFAGKIFTQTVKRVAEEELAQVRKTAGEGDAHMCKECERPIAYEGLCDKCHDEGGQNTAAQTPKVEKKATAVFCPKCGNELNTVTREECPACSWKKTVNKATFTKNDNVLESSWTILEGEKVLISATLGTIWGDEFESNKDWATSEQYGKELLARFESEGVDKVSELLGVTINKEAHTVMDVKTETKIDMPAKKDFVKPGTETKADKEADKTEKALEKVDGTEVGEHLESSKPREDREAAQTPKVEKKADEMPLVDAPKLDTPVMPGEVPAEEKHVPVPPATEEEDMAEAEKVLEHLEGLIKHETAEGEPEDAAVLEKAVLLMKKFMGKESEEMGGEAKPAVEKAPETLPEAPKEEVKLIDLAPSASIKEQELTKKAEELKQKEAELDKQAAKINAEKFSATVNTRTEACKRVVEAMVEREMLDISDEELEAAMDNDTPLLEARKKAFEKVVSRQLTTLLAMDDNSLKAFATSINQVTKKASKTQKAFTLALPVEDSVETEIRNIFSSMGTLKGQK